MKRELLYFSVKREIMASRARVEPPGLGTAPCLSRLSVKFRSSWPEQQSRAFLSITAEVLQSSIFNSSSVSLALLLSLLPPLSLYIIPFFSWQFGCSAFHPATPPCYETLSLPPNLSRHPLDPCLLSLIRPSCGGFNSSLFHSRGRFSPLSFDSIYSRHGTNPWHCRLQFRPPEPLWGSWSGRGNERSQSSGCCPRTDEQN